MKTIDVHLKGSTLVDVKCDCGTPVRLGKEGYYCPKCDERILLNIIPEKPIAITLCEKALWGLQKCNPMKKEVDSPYNRGYQLGWKEAQKLGINLIERVIEELKA